MVQTVGLYLHIPFCRQLCHYCDFAKTANFSASLEQEYWQWLVNSLKEWLSLQKQWFPEGLRFKSVFLGGGTPSLYTREWQAVFAAISPFLLEDAEITLEANPDDMKPENLIIWRDLGINRLSMGIQSFQEKGLKFLTRWHQPDEARAAIELAAREIENINIDLIYAWPGQTEKEWLSDLSQAVQSSVCHLSLYNLTYESGTPIGRRQLRGVLEPMEEARQEKLYHAAREFLANCGFEHQEVSNWARPGFSCQHNWIYWNDEPYLAFGLSASGYLHHNDWPWGLRYQFPKRLGRLLQDRKPSDAASLAGFFESLGAVCESDRDGEAWLLETIGCGLRSRLGIDVRQLERRLSRQFKARPLIQQALQQGWLSWDEQGRLALSPEEWFRETSWSLELALSFEPQIVT